MPIWVHQSARFCTYILGVWSSSPFMSNHQSLSRFQLWLWPFDSRYSREPWTLMHQHPKQNTKNRWYWPLLPVPSLLLWTSTRTFSEWVIAKNRTKVYVCLMNFQRHVPVSKKGGPKKTCGMYHCGTCKSMAWMSTNAENITCRVCLNRGIALFSPFTSFKIEVIENSIALFTLSLSLFEFSKSQISQYLGLRILTWLPYLLFRSGDPFKGG